MRIVICEDEFYYQEAICDVINSWMTTTNRQDVSYVCFQSSEDLLEDGKMDWLWICCF